MQSGALQLSQQDDSYVINKGDSQAILKQFKKQFINFNLLDLRQLVPLCGPKLGEFFGDLLGPAPLG